MNNQTIFILILAVIGLCALIFFRRVKIKLDKTGINVDGGDEKPVANVEDSKRVDINQKGPSESNVKGSEDVKIHHE